MWLHHIRNIKLPAWIRENKKLKAALLLCITLLCADVLLYSILVAPQTGKLTAAEIKYTELKKRRAAAILFEKQKQELSGIKAGMPLQKDMPLLVKDLVQSARNLNLSVGAINYDIPKRTGEEAAMLNFSFPAEGRYADIKRFIYEVERSDRLVGVQDVKMESDKGRVKLALKLLTYVKGR